MWNIEYRNIRLYKYTVLYKLKYIVTYSILGFVWLFINKFGFLLGENHSLATHTHSPSLFLCPILYKGRPTLCYVALAWPCFLSLAFCLFCVDSLSLHLLFLLMKEFSLLHTFILTPRSALVLRLFHMLIQQEVCPYIKAQNQRRREKVTSEFWSKTHNQTFG